MKLTSPIKPIVDLQAVKKIATSAQEFIANQHFESQSGLALTKRQPLLTLSNVAHLCGVEKSKLLYQLKKHADASSAGITSRTELDLATARKWIRKFRCEKLRDSTKCAAVVLAVVNPKSGVGKTNIVATLAHGLSLRGHKILVIDASPQSELTRVFGIDPFNVPSNKTIEAIFLNGDSNFSDVLQTTYWDGVDIVAASPALFNVDLLTQKSNSFNKPWSVLENAIGVAVDSYDAIVIDTPSNIGTLTLNAIMAADGVIFPTESSAADIAGAARYMELFINSLNELAQGEQLTKKLYFWDIVMTKMDKFDLHKAAMRQLLLAAFPMNVLPVEIPSSAIFSISDVKTVYEMLQLGTKNDAFKQAHEISNLFVDLIEAKMTGIWSNDMSSMGVIG